MPAGETAMAWHSGANGTTNTFRDGPWMIAQLGTFAASHTVQCRQTLQGGYYELINKYTMSPNPDYWTAMLWKMTMGQGALPTYSGNADVLAFAHCTQPGLAGVPPGSGISFAVVNLSNSTAYALTVTGMSEAAAALRLEYMLSAPGGQVNSSRMLLNGAPLAYGGPGRLTPLTPAVVNNASAPLVLQPQTYGFVVFPLAANPCYTSASTSR
jgi:heparanase 1